MQKIIFTVALITVGYIAIIYFIPEVIRRQIRKDCLTMHITQREMHDYQNQDCIAVGISVNLPIIEK